MAFRDNLAKLRGLAGEKGYRLEKAPTSASFAFDARKFA
jgi:hypothetical protein